MGYALAVLHTSRITTGRISSSKSIRVFTSRYLVAAPKGGRSPFFVGSRTVPDLSYQLNPSGPLTPNLSCLKDIGTDHRARTISVLLYTDRCLVTAVV
jgi:hypothetical protein